SGERGRSAPTTPRKHREPPLVAPKPVIAALALKPNLESRRAVTPLTSKRPSQDDYDRWRAIPISESPKPTKIQYSSSDGEDGPEDAVGLTPEKLVEKTGSSRRRKGRQSSVHDLVDLWGGGVVQTKERPKDSVHSPAVAAFNGSTKDFAVKLQKSRSIAVPSMAKPGPVSPRMQPSEPSPSQRRSPSRSPKRVSALPQKQASGTNTPASGAAFASSSRMRPQSMFAFPVAKTSSDGKMNTPSTTTTTPSLSVPEDNPRKQGTRRTSISDMVQRYEAIGGKSKGSGSGTPVIAPKSAGLKMPASSAASGGAVDIASTSPSSPLVSKFTASRITASATEDSGPGTEAGKSRPSAIDLARATLIGQDQNKADVSKTRIPVAGLPSTSSRLMPGSPAGRAGPLDGLPASPSFSPAIPTVSPEERSPSPDKPFQGVGKLIDQWQRKTEAESSRTHIPRRGSYAQKRAGLVSGGMGKDN
ncbi:hypothetical protein AZE42_05194, partial [Rhizopogon vesiculosus]